MKKYCIHLAYYGTDYLGWQRQGDVTEVNRKSIQSIVEECLQEVTKSILRINVTATSRTDSGTHALIQYGIFPLEMEPTTLDSFCNEMNQRLPLSIRVHRMWSFDPRKELVRNRVFLKKYVYYIEQSDRPSQQYVPFVWFVRKKWNLFKVKEALQLILGVHDFKPFSQGMEKPNKSTDTKRCLVQADVVLRRSVDVSLDVSSKEETRIEQSEVNSVNGSMDGNYFLCIELIGTGFLTHMVRRIVGTLRWVGEGQHPPSVMQQVLDGKQEAGPSTPSRGLWLSAIWRTEEDWNVFQNCNQQLQSAIAISN